MARKPGPQKSQRKVKRLRDKPGSGVKISIRDFYLMERTQSREEVRTGPRGREEPWR